MTANVDERASTPGAGTRSAAAAAKSSAEAATRAAGADGSAPARPLPVRAVLFDLDGTLADTYADLGGALNRVRGDLGLAPLPLLDLRPHASHGARGLIEAGVGVLPADPRFEPLRLAFLAHYEKCLCEASALFAGVPELLEAIEARGLAWGIVTNKQTRFTEPLVEALGLTARVRTLVCGDTTPHAKPHPAPLLAAAEALRIAPAQCVYVGDAERDMQAGVAAGMVTVVARYGYIRETERPDEWPARVHIDSPLELLDWLP